MTTFHNYEYTIGQVYAFLYVNDYIYNKRVWVKIENYFV